jgi:hypothetical protein
VPPETVNDGDVTAPAGPTSLEDNGVLGIAMGSGEASGHVNLEGNIPRQGFHVLYPEVYPANPVVWGLVPAHKGLCYIFWIGSYSPTVTSSGARTVTSPGL